MNRLVRRPPLRVSQGARNTLKGRHRTLTFGSWAVSMARAARGLPLGRNLFALFVLLLGFLVSAAAAETPVSLITLDPGHFHAALFQKEMLPDVAERVHVYAPPGPDLQAHLDRIARFNSRAENPTHWKLEVHASADFLERMLSERPGNVVVISGNNRGKIDRIDAVIKHGLHVLADKPWIIEPEELPKLQGALNAAYAGVACDAMTQRFEISCLLCREMVNTPDIFGRCLPGSEAEPAVEMESVHYLLKEVAGTPMRRPPWFFDIRQQGEGLADVGTHLVDLVQWTLFPDQAIDFRRDMTVTSGAHWPTVLTLPQFERVTGEGAFPEFLRAAIHHGRLDYFANNQVRYTLRGHHIRLTVKWEFAPPAGGNDTEFALFRGTKSRVEVRQGKEEGFRPEIYVIPATPEQKDGVRAALRQKVEALQTTYPGLAAQEEPGRLHLLIPARYRIGHEAHFALLTQQFLGYIRQRSGGVAAAAASPNTVPAWEKPNMLAKYFVTTKGIELARKATTQNPPSAKGI
jgi:predicted dehydrogenase